MSLAGGDLVNILSTWVPGLSTSSSILTGLQGLVAADDNSAPEPTTSLRRTDSPVNVSYLPPPTPREATASSSPPPPQQQQQQQQQQHELPSAMALQSSSFADLVQSSSPSSTLQNEFEVESLNMAIGRLLNAGMIRHAVALAQQFNYASTALAAVRAAVQLAEGVDPSKVALPSSTSAATTTAVASFEGLVEAAPSAQDCIRRIPVHVEVAEALGTSYQQLIRQRPFDVLKQLLLKGKDTVKLARSFIVVNKLDGLRVARLIAALIQRALLAIGGTNDDKDAGRALMVPEAGPNSTSSPLTADPSWSPAEFIPYANLPGDSGLLGQALLELIVKPLLNPFLLDDSAPPTDQQPQQLQRGKLHSQPLAVSTSPTPAVPSIGSRIALPATVEVELLVRAHYCFGLVSYFEGVERVLAIARERVEASYIGEGKYGLLVRLMSSFRRVKIIMIISSR